MTVINSARHAERELAPDRLPTGGSRGCHQKPAGDKGLRPWPPERLTSM